MKAISLHQPWASLLVTRQPCDCDYWRFQGHLPGCASLLMVKRFETRSWPCPPKIIGQRVAFHAAKRPPDRGWVGDHIVGHHRGATRDKGWRLIRTVRDDLPWKPLPLGAIVGSGVIAASPPIVVSRGRGDDEPHVCHTALGGLYHHRRLDDPDANGETETDVSDQLPYGDWTPGRYAWLIEDAAPTTERCPWCWGEGSLPIDSGDGCWCSVCGGDNVCDPIPAKGHQGFWNWEAM